MSVTERNAEIDQNIKDAIESDEVIFKEVEFSLQTLNKIMEELDEIWLSTPKDELVQNITEYGIDIIANSITIGLEDDSEAQIQHFKDNILDHSAIQFEQREPVVLE